MKKLKIIIDILLFIITIALFNIGLIGNLMHEILGIALAILIIIHILLNQVVAYNLLPLFLLHHHLTLVKQILFFSFPNFMPFLFYYMMD